MANIATCKKKWIEDLKNHCKIILNSFSSFHPIPSLGLVHGSMNICRSVHGSCRVYAGKKQINVEIEFHLVAD